MNIKPLLSFVGVLFVLPLGLSGCDTLSSIKNIEMPSLSMPSMPSLSAPAAAEATPTGLVAKTGAECPQVKALTDLSSIAQFVNAKTPSADKMIAEAKIENVGATCAVAPASVSVELSLDFLGTLGPVGVKDMNGQANYTYPYFLTVVTPDGKILSKDVFALSMVYDKGGISLRKQDKLRQVIPLAAGQQANQYQILIGFQLSDDELAYNRSKTGK